MLMLKQFQRPMMTLKNKNSEKLQTVNLLDSVINVRFINHKKFV